MAVALRCGIEGSAWRICTRLADNSSRVRSVKRDRATPVLIRAQALIVTGRDSELLPTEPGQLRSDEQVLLTRFEQAPRLANAEIEERLARHITFPDPYNLTRDDLCRRLTQVLWQRDRHGCRFNDGPSENCDDVWMRQVLCEGCLHAGRLHELRPCNQDEANGCRNFPRMSHHAPAKIGCRLASLGWTERKRARCDWCPCTCFLIATSPTRLSTE